MADLRKIVRSNPLSEFRNYRPQGGMFFATVADLANTAYEALEPRLDEALQARAGEDAVADAGTDLGGAPLTGGGGSGTLAGGAGGDTLSSFWNRLSAGGLDANAVRAVVGGESGGDWTIAENPNYSPARAREIFSAMSGLSDAQISALASQGPEAFFEAAYGPGTGPGRNLGNTNPGDGGRYYGRGLIQLTGRGNYERYARLTGHDILNDPDLLIRDENVAADVTLAYLQDRTTDTGDPVADIRAAVAGGRDTAGFTRNIEADRRRYEAAQRGSDTLAGSAGQDRLGQDFGHTAPNGWQPTYRNQNSTRNQPLSRDFVNRMSFLGDMGIEMRVISGGQDAAGTPNARRTGTRNHDHGNAADVEFYQNGRILDWENPADQPVLEDIMTNALARGVTGFGAGDDYMGRNRWHIGGGSAPVWGAGGRSANAPQWLRDMYQRASQRAGRLTGGGGSDRLAGGEEADAILTQGEADVLSGIMENRAAPDEVRSALEQWRAAEDVLASGRNPETGGTVGDVALGVWRDRRDAARDQVRAWFNDSGEQPDVPALSRRNEQRAEDRMQAPISDGNVIPPGRPQVRPVAPRPPAPSPTMSAPPPAPQVASEPESVVQTAGGNLARRRLNLLGRSARVYNAAYATAYMSEALNQGAVDIQGLAARFPGDPNAFLEAARGYLDQTVQRADPSMRAELRQDLGAAVTRRYMGLVDEQQTEIRNRANNSSRALMERWAQEYAEALVLGDQDTIGTARQQLEGILAAREVLPGVAWTREQSENVIRAAIATSEQLRERQRRDQEGQWRSALDTVIAAAEDGLTAEGEVLLQNPEVWAALPEEAERAAAAIDLREASPGFNALPPDQQDAVIADMRAGPVSSETQVRTIRAAEEMAGRARRGWREDPIAQAQDVMGATPLGTPPPLPSLEEFDPNDPTAFMQALGARAEYGRRLANMGYTAAPAYLSNEEARGIRSMMTADLPAAQRLTLMTGIASAFGSDAVRVAAHIGGIDPVLRGAGMMAAGGGDPTVALEIIEGMDLMRAGTAPRRTRLPVDAGVQSILSSFSGSDQEMVSQMALALAARRGVEDLTPEASLEAVNAVLGQSVTDQGTFGGIQTVFGAPAVMPQSMTGADAEAAIRAGIGAGMFYVRGEPMQANQVLDRFPNGALGGENRLRLHYQPNSNTYTMMVDNGGGQMWPVEDSTGRPLFFDLEAMFDTQRTRGTTGRW